MSKEAELVLNAFVAEAHKNVADFMSVTSDSLNITEEAFYNALIELEKMGCIKNIQWCIDGACLYDDIEIYSSDYKMYK